eukprot:Skav219073  [mRNA]  locus=scaffold1777:36820:41641:- [translate_table: standard]
MGITDAAAEEFTYFCRCDVCRCSLFRGDNWYHKPGTNYDLCARDFGKLPEEERQIYVNIATSSDLGVQQDEYILESKQYLARCDSCRKAVSLGEDWYHKQEEGNHDLCAHHYGDLPESTKKDYVKVYASKASCAWLELQKKTGIEGLKRTTAHEPDYDKLMKYRIDLLRENNIKIQDMIEVVKDLKPLPGAKEFLDWLKPLVPRILLLTDHKRQDTFEEYAMPMFEQLGYPSVFCNSLVVDSEGFICDHILRLKDQKRDLD